MLSVVALRSRRLEVADELEANELYQRSGWTDGLPIVAPTEARVAACLEAAGMAADEVLGTEPVRHLLLTAEKVAVNAVMAGCLPAYFPVVAAAVQAMCEEPFLLHGATASTGGSAPVLIVNGPIRRALGMNATDNALANGSRANATIGRAVRLVLVNLLACVPGGLDRSTLGHPGKFTFCLAEDEEGSPWVPLAEERGIPRGASAVTVVACAPPRQVMNEWTTDPAEILETFAAEMRANMLGYSIWSGNYVLVIPKQLRDLIVAAGWQKQEIREYVHRAARVRRSDWHRVGKGRVAGGEDTEFAALGSPEDLLVVAAGGPAGGFGMVVPPWFGSKSRAVTRAIGLCLEC
ncbi:MAG: hypothetical protein E6J76_08635 [Deltaproteobacteria bacterium]|nr:MAG: hypothetical protein E6J76_08635 [Deltaproteobacteria bacterium]